MNQKGCGAKVIKSKYGGLREYVEEEGHLTYRNGDRINRGSPSGWWSDICEIYRGEGAGGLRDEI